MCDDAVLISSNLKDEMKKMILAYLNKNDYVSAFINDYDRAEIELIKKLLPKRGKISILEGYIFFTCSCDYNSIYYLNYTKFINYANYTNHTNYIKYPNFANHTDKNHTNKNNDNKNNDNKNNDNKTTIETGYSYDRIDISDIIAYHNIYAEIDTFNIYYIKQFGYRPMTLYNYAYRAAYSNDKIYFLLDDELCYYDMILKKYCDIPDGSYKSIISKRKKEIYINIVILFEELYVCNRHNTTYISLSGHILKNRGIVYKYTKHICYRDETTDNMCIRNKETVLAEFTPHTTFIYKDKYIKINNIKYVIDKNYIRKSFIMLD